MEDIISDTNEQSVANLHRKEFDLLPASRQISIRAIEFSQLTEVADFAAAHFPELNLGDFARVKSVVEHDRRQIQLFYKSGRLVGLYAMLFLNKTGFAALLNGNFVGAKPNLDHLAGPGTTPCAIYTWFVACPGRPVIGFGNVSEFLRGERFANADLFARPASPAGHRLMLGIGYQPLGADPDGLHRYVRIANRRSAKTQARGHA